MSSFNRINPLLAKILVIALLTLVLLVPLGSVRSLVGERTTLRSGAVQRVANGVGQAQRIGAMIMAVPLTRSWVSDDGKVCSQTRQYYLLANSTELTGTGEGETRKSGIYRVPAFRAVLHISGSIDTEPLNRLLAAESGVSKKIGSPVLFLAVSDPKGIRTLDGIRIEDTLVPVAPATVAGLQGVAAELSSALVNVPRPVAFAADLVLTGTEQLQFLPFAKDTRAHLASTWPNPSFSGAYSPDGAPRVGPKGFTADWHVLQINRGYPQFWSDQEVSENTLSHGAFGVDFYQPVDSYQCDYRAIHYAVLFIALTFMTLFLWEHSVGTPIHAVQYAMTGAALSVFYLVLVALSEHLDFAAAYALAASALTLLMAVYFSGVLKSGAAGAATGALAAVCYSLMYLLVLSEDYALLLGALAIFFVLSAIMVGTRKLDWFRVAESHRRVP